MKINNKPQLHKTVHWRRLKSIIRELFKKENIDINEYNIDHITCYSTFGYELKGKNVKFITQDRIFLLGWG